MRVACKTQDSVEWFSARVGRVTGSNIFRAMDFVWKGSKKRGDKRLESSADRKKYIEELAWELITQVPTEHYVSKAMDIGKSYENEARIELGFFLGAEIDETGFVLHPELNHIGSSPDGYLTENEIVIPVELKVPLLKTHESYILRDVIPEEYIPQLHCEMLCCDRAPYGYFASYAPQEIYPELPEEFRLFVKKLMANPGEVTEESHDPKNCQCWLCMEEAATKTMEEAMELVKELTARYPKGERPVSRVTQQLRASMEESITAEDIAWAQAGFPKEIAP